MIGGGTFTTMNKVLDGAYINYVSAARASKGLADRGTAALPIELNWGVNGSVIEVTSSDFEKDSMAIFGYSHDSEELKPIRELFRGAIKGIFYKLNGGDKATCSISTAKCSGTRGNDIKHVVSVNVDDTAKYDVVTYVGTKKVDTQTVTKATDLVDNDFVVFTKNATLETSAGINLTGGTNAEVTGAEHQAALDALESYSFNTLGCMSATDTVKALYVSYTKRMRDEAGVKFTLVVHQKAADYIGVVNVKNKVEDTGAPDYALIPWVCGAEAGCAVNKTCDNKEYDGEYTVNVKYKQTELESMIKNGEFALHKSGSSIYVLNDINSFVSVTDEMNEDFQLNQVMRVLDQIALEEASAFNSNYVGKIQNDADGRVSLWSAVVSIHEELQKIHAIEEFTSDDITVEKGSGKRSVVLNSSCKPVCAMGKLYSTVCCI